MPELRQPFTPTHEQQLKSARIAIEASIMAITLGSHYIFDDEERATYIRDTMPIVGNLCASLLVCEGNPRRVMEHLCDVLEDNANNRMAIDAFRVQIADKIPTCLNDADGTCGTE